MNVLTSLPAATAGPSRLSVVPTLTRSFHSTPISSSHVGSLPLPVPPRVTLDFSPQTPTSTNRSRELTITGPLGRTVLSIPPCVNIRPPTETSPVARVTVTDSTVKHQKSLWGLTRSLLANAVQGVDEGYKLSIRLVGVGYRATVEPISESQTFSPPLTMTNTSSARSVASSTANATHRINLKLGYAHPILIPIPEGITVTTPQPTRIVLQGVDKQKLGLFAAMIRRWRKPEPYRGKGIFVGDETIKIKEIKKK